MVGVGVIPASISALSPENAEKEQQSWRSSSKDKEQEGQDTVSIDSSEEEITGAVKCVSFFFLVRRVFPSYFSHSWLSLEEKRCNISKITRERINGGQARRA